LKLVARRVVEREAGRGALAFVVFMLALLALPPAASAVLSGYNGRIVFISGRDGGDGQAKPYLRTILSGVGAGSAGAALTGTAGQHRHPTWSPDRTKIAYARGVAGAGCPCDIFILDLTSPGATPQNITNTPNIDEDRPAWSPDGTRIAYESAVTAGSTRHDILVGPATQGTSVPTINLTNTGGAGQFEGKPAWTPDSGQIYYHKLNPQDPAANTNIVRRPSTGGAETLGLNDSGIKEFQPSISPDGKSLCYTLGTAFDGTADVLVAPFNQNLGRFDANGGFILSQENIGTAPQNGDYNCTWSPDGRFVAYVQGTFGNGSLVMERSDNSPGGLFFLEDVAGVFDGNPDWAPDGRPACNLVAASASFESPVTLPLECLDTGPGYERTPTTENLATDAGPTNGTLSPLQQGDPSTVTYTPNNGFSGTDSFEYFGRDALSSGPRSKVTITVAPRGQGDQGAPGFSLFGDKVQKPGRRVKASATCDEPCRARVEGRIVVKPKGEKRKTFGLRPAQAQLEALDPRELKLRATKKARKAVVQALKKRGKAKAKLSGTGTDGAGNESPEATLTIKLSRRTNPQQ
jgi:Tol biopolymer transport system component